LAVYVTLLRDRLDNMLAVTIPLHATRYSGGSGRKSEVEKQLGQGCARI